MEEIRPVIGEGIVINDIIPQSLFMDEVCSMEVFETFIRRAAAVFKDDPPVILGIGDMLPCNGSIKRFERMIQIIEEKTKI